MTSKSSASKTVASKPATVTFSPYLMRRHREQLADWLHANGVDVEVVSMQHAIHVEGDTIRYRAFDLSTDVQATKDGPAGDAGTVQQTARCNRPALRLTVGDAEAD